MMKERPILFASEMVRAILDGRKSMTRRIAKLNETLFRDEYPDLKTTAIEAALKISPFQVGMRLWVREAWCEIADAFYYRATDCVEYAAVLQDVDWKPSIHMPRKASRITLELESVRVERLAEITSKDVVAEGYPFSSDLDQFKWTWSKLYGQESWDLNPFVWVLSFRRLP